MSDALLPAPGAEVEASTWPPLETVEVGPWRAGRSGGFTRRANSARLVPGADAREALAALDDLERTYADAGLPCVVRVPTGRSPDVLDPDLAAGLTRRGYRTGVVSRVLARTLEDAGPALDLPPDVILGGAADPDDAWLAGWLGTKTRSAGPVADEASRRLLRGAPAVYLTASRLADGGDDGDDGDAGAVGTIRAAWCGSWAALSCLAVAPSARRRGVGRSLTVAALREARGVGATAAFLQVETGNAPAAALYASLGFSDVDEYAYLHAPEGERP